MSWTATILEPDYDALQAHLFRPDEDEHAAFLYAGLAESERGRQLLVRRIVPVPDHEFVASDRGAYRQIVPRAVARAALECDDLGLCLLWAHSHPLSWDRVEFSGDDLRAHGYGHPAMIDMTHDRPVTGLVFGRDAVAGEVWVSGEEPARLESLRVVGSSLRTLTPAPIVGGAAAGRFARQVLMFGARGQSILRAMTVAVVGAGGGGSLLVQMLAHLGVGRIVVVDYDVVGETNLSRIVGAGLGDVGRLKVKVMQDLVARIDPTLELVPVAGDIFYADDARELLVADFAFLATDNILSRYAFNLVCHQYLIPGIQVGAKVTSDVAGGIELIHVMERPLILSGPCLYCVGAIPEDELAREQNSPEERRAQAYVDGDVGAEVEEPSVITLNAVSSALAATDFLLIATGLLPATTALDSSAYYPLERELRGRLATKRPGCRFCGDGDRSALARGDLKALSLRPGRVPPNESVMLPRAPASVIEQARGFFNKIRRRTFAGRKET
jgi:molybdopterin/thiamine biosynthesis adenylyltransferase